ncbi:hypothetical protein [Micromonospora nigra]|uniref:hypothetical protein n=1 Tax=Micromonospora nigra TaxID=145857 RepID=UPI000B867A31|nr:hypothetical protein [Micromonospora nigra]
MLLDPELENEVAYELCQLVGRAILPVRRGGEPGTAFFHQMGTDEFLVTAESADPADGEIGLRPSVTEPAGVAPGVLPVPAAWWSRPGASGVAVLPVVRLRERADREGWRWRTQSVADGFVAGADTIDRIGAEPGSAFVLALGVRDDGARPLEVAVERVVRDGAVVRVTTVLPTGYVGAPVFGVEAAEGGPALACLGLVLPAVGGGHPLATFDRVRAALTAHPWSP